MVSLKKKLTFPVPIKTQHYYNTAFSTIFSWRDDDDNHGGNKESNIERGDKIGKTISQQGYNQTVFMFSFVFVAIRGPGTRSLKNIEIHFYFYTNWGWGGRAGPLCPKPLMVMQKKRGFPPKRAVAVKSLKEIIANLIRTAIWGLFHIIALFLPLPPPPFQ